MVTKLNHFNRNKKYSVTHRVDTPLRRLPPPGRCAEVTQCVLGKVIHSSG